MSASIQNSINNRTSNLTNTGNFTADFTDHGILLGQGMGTAVVATAEMSDGQLLIGSTGNNPVTTAITAGTGITITNAPGAITLSATAQTFPWTTVTDTTQQLAINNGYIINNTAAVTLVLPTAAVLGSTIKVIGKGTGLFTITQAANQIIHFVSQSTTTGTAGNLASISQHCAIEIVCVTPDNEYTVESSSGNFNIT